MVTSKDIENMDLHGTEIVVLSACETGLGFDFETGDFLGLQSGFFKAGAASIIVSLWKIEDKITSEFFINFYTKWLKIGDKFEAFRASQIFIEKKYKHPFYWAGFILIEK